MTISANEAGSMLADVDAIVARVKRSRLYRRTGEITIMWGVLTVLGHLAELAAPHWALWSWIADNALGVALTFVLIQRARAQGQAQIPLRLLGGFALFFAFGFIWSDLIGQFEPRQVEVFWPSLFLFGYALAGLWFGAAFSALGLGVTALILAGYFWAGPWLSLWLAVFNGGGFILCGLWMRRS